MRHHAAVRSCRALEILEGDSEPADLLAKLPAGHGFARSRLLLLRLFFFFPAALQTDVERGREAGTRLLAGHDALYVQDETGSAALRADVLTVAAVDRSKRHLRYLLFKSRDG